MFRASDELPKHILCKTLGFIYPRARTTQWLHNYIRLHNRVATVIRILLLGLFSIIWGRRNGFEFRSSALSMPITSSILTTHFTCLFYKSHSTCLFSVFVSISFLVGPTGASVIILSTCSSSLLLTCPHVRFWLYISSWFHTYWHCIDLGTFVHCHNILKP